MTKAKTKTHLETFYDKPSAQKLKGHVVFKSDRDGAKPRVLRCKKCSGEVKFVAASQRIFKRVLQRENLVEFVYVAKVLYLYCKCDKSKPEPGEGDMRMRDELLSSVKDYFQE